MCVCACVCVQVRANGLALKFASDGLQEDREVVAAATEQNWSALCHAGDICRADEGLVFAAVKQDVRQNSNLSSFFFTPPGHPTPHAPCPMPHAPRPTPTLRVVW